MSADLLVPGRPSSDPQKGCPFCLENGLFEGQMIMTGQNGFVAELAPDLAIVIPHAHLDNEFWDPAVTDLGFAMEFFMLLGAGITTMRERYGWESYNWYANAGFNSGQRVFKDGDGVYRHPHVKIKQRVSGKPSSGWGLDALANMVDNCPHEHKP